MIKQIAFAIFIALLVIAPARGQDLAKGLAAAKRGDYATALREWRPLAEQGHAEAQYGLGVMYGRGAGVPKDGTQAVYWYRKAAEQGHASAQSNLGHHYEKGLGVTQDYSVAAGWYRKAAKKGLDLAQFNLGRLYTNGLGVPKNYVEAKKWFHKASEQGLTDAQFEIGNLYRLGQGVRQNYAEAVKWYRKAAERGNVRALNSLGSMYAEGQGVPQDYVEAVKWYRRAAERGDPTGQTNLALRYAMGLDVPQDLGEAVKWFRKAAEQGYALAQVNLGLIYKDGRGVPQDYTQAMRWLRKAAEQGQLTAQFNLGKLYEDGLGVPQNYTEAVQWYRRAARQGDADGQYHLARMYEEGLGVLQDYAAAAIWFEKSTAQGHVSALNDFAWMLATNKHPRFRNGKKAVALATKAVTLVRDPDHLDTLAAAHAESGNFKDAVRVQRDAIRMLQKIGAKPEEVKDFQSRLGLYRAKKPYRDLPETSEPMHAQMRSQGTEDLGKARLSDQKSRLAKVIKTAKEKAIHLKPHLLGYLFLTTFYDELWLKNVQKTYGALKKSTEGEIKIHVSAHGPDGKEHVFKLKTLKELNEFVADFGLLRSAYGTTITQRGSNRFSSKYSAQPSLMCRDTWFSPGEVAVQQKGFMLNLSQGGKVFSGVSMENSVTIIRPPRSTPTLVGQFGEIIKLKDVNSRCTITLLAQPG